MTTTDLTFVDIELPLPKVRTEFDPYEFHKARYQNEKSSIADRDASGQWLLANGFIGCNGRMIVLRGGK